MLDHDEELIVASLPDMPREQAIVGLVWILSPNYPPPPASLNLLERQEYRIKHQRKATLDMRIADWMRANSAFALKWTGENLPYGKKETGNE